MDYPEDRNRSDNSNIDNAGNTGARENTSQNQTVNPDAVQNGYMGNRQFVRQNNPFNQQQNQNTAPQYSETQGQPYPPPYYGNMQSPAQIYENSRNNTGAPRYHYGRPFPVADDAYLREQRIKEQNKREAKRSLRKAGTFAGFAMFLFVAFSGFFASLLSMFNLYEMYDTNSLFSSAVGIIYSVVTIAVPFGALGLLFKKNGNKFEIPFNTPCSPPSKTLLLIFTGLGWCLIANYVTNVFSSMLENFGIYLDSPAGPEPANLKELLLMFLSVSIIPPLCEELAMRGVILQSMKKHGKTFAVFASAFVFGVFHGNPAQIPFAFMCGLILGFVCIESGSIWTSVVVHALVNTLSVLYSGLLLYTNENTADAVSSTVSLVLLFAGALSLFVYFVKYKKQSFPVSDNIYPDLSLGARFRAFLSSPVIIAATIVFLGEAFMQISFYS